MKIQSQNKNNKEGKHQSSGKRVKMTGLRDRSQRIIEEHSLSNGWRRRVSLGLFRRLILVGGSRPLIIMKRILLMFINLNSAILLAQ